MSDDEVDPDVEGEEDEEGGESEKEEEEVKEPPKILTYVPKIDPLTQVMNINRNLDMLNSEVNVISSEFMVMSSAMGGRPKFYNVNSGNQYSSTNYNYVKSPYTSPVRHNAGTATYWNNPNHISLSPSKYHPPGNSYANKYATSGGYSSDNIYKPSAYMSSPVRNSYSPSRYQMPGYAPPPSIPSGLAHNPADDYNVGKLINDIDNVLNNPIPKPPPPVPNLMPMEQTYNTFDRAYPPSFRPAQEIITQVEPERGYMPDYKPPLYGRRTSLPRNNSFTRVDDFYNRRPPTERQNIVQQIQANPRGISPLRSAYKERSPHFERPRSAARPPPAPATDFEIHDAVKTLFR